MPKRNKPPENDERRSTPIKRPKSQGKSRSGLSPIATIHATFTDSVERLGRDVSIYGLSLIAAIVALWNGQDALHVALLLIVLIVGWPTFKVGSALADKFRATDELDTALREGDAVLEKHEADEIGNSKDV